MNNTNQDNKQQKKKNIDKAMFRVVDHLVIKDKKTGKTLVNKRG